MKSKLTTADLLHLVDGLGTLWALGRHLFSVDRTLKEIPKRNEVHFKNFVELLSTISREFNQKKPLSSFNLSEQSALENCFGIKLCLAANLIAVSTRQPHLFLEIMTVC